MAKFSGRFSILSSLLILISYLFISGCSTSQKQRQEQRDKVSASSGLYCEFISGDVHNDVDVEVNLQMGKRCDGTKPFSITNYKNSSENFGVIYCCSIVKKDGKDNKVETKHFGPKDDDMALDDEGDPLNDKDKDKLKDATKDLKKDDKKPGDLKDPKADPKASPKADAKTPAKADKPASTSSSAPKDAKAANSSASSGSGNTPNSPNTPSSPSTGTPSSPSSGSPKPSSPTNSPANNSVPQNKPPTKPTAPEADIFGE